MSGVAANLNDLVVGVDGSPSSERAFRWACAQAHGGVVTGVHGFSPITALLAASVQIELDDTRARQAELLETRWTSAKDDPTVTIETAMIDDEPAAALEQVAAGRAGSVIVIGQRGDATPLGGHIGDIGTRLLHGATAPVIVVSPATVTDAVSGPVVVGVHGVTSADDEPVKFAATFATDRQLPLRLVAISDPMVIPTGTAADATMIEQERRASHDSEVRRVESLAGDVAARFPALEVTSTVLDGHPTISLAAELAVCGAGLAVIGNHHHSALASIVNGSVARYLPAVSPCPVAAVPVV